MLTSPLLLAMQMMFALGWFLVRFGAAVALGNQDTFAVVLAGFMLNALFAGRRCLCSRRRSAPRRRVPSVADTDALMSSSVIVAIRMIARPNYYYDLKNSKEGGLRSQRDVTPRRHVHISWPVL